MRKRLLLITTSFPDSHSGEEAAGSFVADLAKELDKNLDVVVVCPGKQETSDVIDGVLVERFKAPTQALSTLKLSKPIDAMKILRVLNAGQKKCLSVCENHKIDHIFALWVLPSGYWAKHCSKKFGIPYSTWALGSDIWSLGKIPIVKNILSNILNKSHCNFADGLQLCKDVQKLSSKNCTFLASTRLNTQVPPKKKPVNQYKLAFLGRWHPNKGTDILLDALRALDDKDWREISEFRFAGGGPQESLVKSSIDLLTKQGKNVKLYGYLNKQKAAELIHWADWLIIPSRIESIPVIFSDAISASTPIVCTPAGDLPELVVKHKFGIVSKNFTAEELTISIKQALTLQPVEFTKEIEQLRAKFQLENTALSLLQDLNLASEET